MDHELHGVGGDDVWLGSITTAPTTHGLRRATLAGAVLGPATLVATLPTAPAGSFSGIAFDQNCNPIVSGGAVPPGTGGIFRVHRFTGAVTNLLTPHPALPAGTANCVDADQATGDIYFGVTSAGGAIYRLPGPFPNTAPPVLVGTTVTNATIAGLAFWPAHGVNPARVYWNNFAAANNCVGYVPAARGASVTVAGAPTAWGSGNNWITYDRRADDLWTVTAGINPDNVFTLTDAGVNTLVATLPPGGVNGSLSCIDANDHPNGSLRLSAIPAGGADAGHGRDLGLRRAGRHRRDRHRRRWRQHHHHRHRLLRRLGHLRRELPGHAQCRRTEQLRLLRRQLQRHVHRDQLHQRPEVLPAN